MTAAVRDVRQLKRMGRHAKAVLGLGVVASLAANILASTPKPSVSWVIAAWSPIALALTVDLITKVPVCDSWLSWLRVMTTATIAGIAGWVSYWHMVEVALAHGEANVAAHLLPFSVDGLVIVASIALHELDTQSRNTRANNGVDSVGRRPAADRPTQGKSVRPALIAPTSSPAAGPAVPRPRSKTASNGSSGNGSAREVVQALAAAEPALTQLEIADRLGISDRTVRRHLPIAAEATNTTTDVADETGEEAA